MHRVARKHPGDSAADGFGVPFARSERGERFFLQSARIPRVGRVDGARALAFADVELARICDRDFDIGILVRRVVGAYFTHQSFCRLGGDSPQSSSCRVYLIFCMFHTRFKIHDTYFTNSIRAASTTRFPTLPSRTMRVYPPARFAYRGAYTSWSFFTTSVAPPIRVSRTRRDASVFFLALVTMRSTNGRSSFAFATVVVMPSWSTRERASPRKSAVRWPFLRPNVLFFL